MIDAAFPLWTDFGSGPVMFHHPSGTSAWSDADLTWTNDEGFHTVQIDDTVLIRGCTAPDPETLMCGAEVLMGVDAATGAERWRYDGSGGVIAGADGHAIVSTEGADGTFEQAVIDVVSGEVVEGQRWTEPMPFLVGCCGDPAFTVVDGDSVLTSDGTTLQLFVPAADAAPTVDVTLSLSPRHGTASERQRRHASMRWWLVRNPWSSAQSTAWVRLVAPILR